MDVQMLTDFFLWCMIVNVIVYAWAALWLIIAPDFVFRMQGRLLSVTRERFDGAVYAYLGAYKLLIIVFNFTPYVALSIIA